MVGGSILTIIIYALILYLTTKSLKSSNNTSSTPYINARQIEIKKQINITPIAD